MMWTRGAAVCSLLFAVPACDGGEGALTHLPALPYGTSDPGSSPKASTAWAPPSATSSAGGAGSTGSSTPADAGKAIDAGGAIDGGPFDTGGAIDGGLGDRGFEALSWSAIPSLTASTFHEFSSYDRDEASTFPFVSPGNKDFNAWLAICGDRPTINYGSIIGGAACDPGLEGYLIASDDSGPGYVSRIFFTHDDFDGAAPKDQEKIRIYADDLSTPAYEGKLSDWKNGTAEPFVEPLVGWTSGATVSYVPISYDSKLRILLDDLSPTAVYYYQIGVKSSAPTAPFRPATLESVGDLGARLRTDAKRGTARAVWANQASSLAAGDTAHLLDQRGPGTIESLVVSVDGATPAALAALELQVTWDDAEEPAIKVPLDALFGQRPRLAGFDTLPMTVRLVDTSVELTLSFPMPFAVRARIDAMNTGTASQSLRARVEGTSARVAFAGYLHVATQNRTAPMAPGSRFPIAELSGGGRYVGSVVNLEGKADTTLPVTSPLNFLEGDDATVIDGKAVGHGTGTEDFLDGGWYFENGPYSSPFAALISISDASQAVGQISAVRFQVLGDALDFQSTLALSLEYGANQPGTALRYSSVAFYYSQ